MANGRYWMPLFPSQATMVSDDAYWFEYIKVTGNVDLAADRAHQERT